MVLRGEQKPALPVVDDRLEVVGADGISVARHDIRVLGLGDHDGTKQVGEFALGAYTLEEP